VKQENASLRAFRNPDKQSISELKLARNTVFKLIKKWLFSRFCSLYPSGFWGSLKSFLGVTKWPHLSQSREWSSISEAERKADQRQTRCLHICEQVAMDSESKRLFEPSTPETGSRAFPSLSQNGKG